ncbi:Membrane protein involved in the export of O-antigen and teichoic acid [Rhizobium sp. RU20A]|nr:Membrane protein involved in the export of O-antigen and teichoic acid [Rhizobium sp. RU20A]
MLGKAIIAFLQLMLLARILTPAQIGLLALTLTVTNTAQMISDIGISNALIHFSDQTENELRSLYWLNLLTGFIITVIVALLSEPIAAFYRAPEIVPLLLLASIYFVVWASAQQFRVLAERDLDISTLAKIELLSFFLGFCITISLAHRLGPMAVVLGFIANAVINSGLVWVFLRKNFSFAPRLRFNEVSRYVLYGVKILLTNVVNTFSLQSDVIVVGRVFGSSTLGLYSQPREFGLRIMFVINPIITRVAFPLMAKAKDDRGHIQRIYHKTLRMTASINFPIYFFIAVFAEDVTAIVLGPQWQQAAGLMRLFAIWCAFRSVGNPSSSLLFSTGHTTRALMSATLVMLSLFGLAWIGSSFSHEAVIYLMIGFYIFLIPAFWAGLVRPVCGSSFWNYHKQVIIPAVCASCAAVVAFFATRYLDPGFIRLGVGGSVGGLVYLASSYIINREWLDEMVEFALKRKRRRGDAS